MHAGLEHDHRERQVRDDGDAVLLPRREPIAGRGIVMDVVDARAHVHGEVPVRVGVVVCEALRGARRVIEHVDVHVQLGHAAGPLGVSGEREPGRCLERPDVDTAAPGRERGEVVDERVHAGWRINIDVVGARRDLDAEMTVRVGVVPRGSLAWVSGHGDVVELKLRVDQRQAVRGEHGAGDEDRGSQRECPETYRTRDGECADARGLDPFACRRITGERVGARRHHHRKVAVDVGIVVRRRDLEPGALVEEAHIHVLEQGVAALGANGPGHE